MPEQDDVYLNEDAQRLLIARLNRIEGQVRGVKRMIERREPCDAILLQIASLRAAIAQVGRLLLEEHMRSCVLHAVRRGQGERELKRLGSALDSLIT